MQNNNSKVNTILLVIVVILLGIGIWKFGWKKEIEPLSQGSCIVGGCNGNICYDSDSGTGNSNCMPVPSMVCYKSATCERQNTGKCGWTQTSQLQQCLDSHKEW